MKKNRKKERLIAWLISGTIFLILFSGLVVAGFYGFKYVKTIQEEKVKQQEIEEAKKAAEEAAKKEAEEAEAKAKEEEAASEESFDQEALDAIFSDEEEIDEEMADEEEDIELTQKATEFVEGMTIEQKVAQLFFIKQEAITDVDVCTAAGDKTKEALSEYPVGGIIYFADNIEDPEQLKTMTTKLQGYSKEIMKLPIFIGIDEEGGSVTRIAKNENFEVSKVDTMEEIGLSGDKDKAYEAGNTIGTYLAEYGFNVNFAPDADVITNTNNVIKDRSFGTDPNVVADMVVAYASGLKDANVLACAKHYPGHGAVEADTHEGEAIIDRSWIELEETELVPFKRAAREKLPFIMVSHICVPALTVDNIPASLSGLLITDKLRGDIGYKGIIITDSLAMGAIDTIYSSDEAAVKALQAGADMLLMPMDFKAAYEGVLNAVSEGTISEERVNESVIRIVKEKIKLNGEE